jgi:hypothetical protein
VSPSSLVRIFVLLLVNTACTTSRDRTIIAKYHHDHRHYDTVVHILNEKGRDLVLKLEDSPCTVENIVTVTIKALQRKELNVPYYLKYIAQIDNHDYDSMEKVKDVIIRTDNAVKAELDFAELSGVIGTNVVRIFGHDAIKVTYIADVISCKLVLRHALFHLDAFTAVYYADQGQQADTLSEFEKLELSPKLIEMGSTRRLRPGRKPKYFLRLTMFRHVPLTSLQSMLINLAISKNQPQDANDVLSPRQLAILEAVDTKTPRRETIDEDIAQA